MSFAALKKQSRSGSLTERLMKKVEKLNEKGNNTDERLWKPAVDKAGNGLNIAEGALYVQYDPGENNRAGFRFYVRHAKGATKATGTSNPSMTAGHAFTISVSQANGTMSTAQTVTLTGVDDLLTLVIIELSMYVDIDKLT